MSGAQIGSDVTGSSLLSLVDRLALEVFPEAGNISTGNISEHNAITENLRL